ncbi:hypothetical protein MES5069_1320003 [Mesorhizobium escarrei]|uniref:Uncharacterized protein n=1 Tax=Mesorhizobium escarrei TaxID=666018 RepID=A0ABN8JKK3_9HYPH|nr:hypothetical protein MES5069_1320003 [Mesorhizobium escarrei]
MPALEDPQPEAASPLSAHRIPVSNAPILVILLALAVLQKQTPFVSTPRAWLRDFGHS